MPDETKTYVLEDLEVNEVSVVDRGANKRKLLVIKRSEDMPQDATAEDIGNETPKKDPVVEAQAEKASENTELIVGLPEEVAKTLGTALVEMSQRLAALGEAAKAAPVGEGGVTDKFKSEVMGVSTVLRMMIGAEKSGELAAFLEKGLLMEPATPMAKMPMQDAAPEYVMTEQGLMMKMPPDAMKQMACKYAMDKVFEAEDALHKGDAYGCCVCLYICMKALGPFIPDDSGMPQQMAYALKAISLSEADFEKQYAFNQPQPSIAAGVPDSHPPVNSEKPGSGVSDGNLAKAGRKIAGAKLSKLEELLAQLGTLVADLRPAEVAKAEDGVADPDMHDKLLKLARIVKAQRAEIEQLHSARPSGNAGKVEGDDDNTSEGKVLWPDDLNALDDPDLQL